MDLKTLSIPSKLAVLQKTRYDSLIRVRKTCKSLDSFVEDYRFEIARNPIKEIAFEFRILFNESNNEVEVRFEVVIGRTKSILIQDPFKQLSAIAFLAIHAKDKRSTTAREQYTGMEHINILENILFSILRKMKLICYRVNSLDLGTQPTLIVAELIRCRWFALDTYGNRLAKSPNFDLEEVMANPVVQRINALALNKFSFSRGSRRSRRILEMFILYSEIAFYYFKPKLTIKLILQFCELPNFGNLKTVQFETVNEILPRFQIPEGAQVLYQHTILPNDYRVVYLFNGVAKWIICNMRTYVARKNYLKLKFIDKDPSILLDTLLKMTLRGKPGTSSIRGTFVNAPNMEARFEIFKEFSSARRPK